jgi:hypothetical protein
MNIKGLSQKQKARIADYHNPYLFLELEGEFENTIGEATVDQKQLYFTKLQNPPAFYDLFGEDEKGSIRSTFEKPHSKISPPNIETGRDTIISREHLEELLDEVLGLYKTHMTRSDWAQVSNYRSEFLDQASRSPATTRRVAAGLEKLKFPLIPGEKVEFNRARAERIIVELKRLLI